MNNMSRAVESLTAGVSVSHNTGRVGAVCGEYSKLRKHLEWAMDVSMGDVLKKNAKNRTERDQALQELMTQLFESMDKLHENMQKIPSGWKIKPPRIGDFPSCRPEFRRYFQWISKCNV